MLDDGDGAEVAKNPEQDEQKRRVKVITPADVLETVPNQFLERGRQISPRVWVRDRIERQRKSRPSGPAKNQRQGDPPDQFAERFAACRRWHHFPRCGRCSNSRRAITIQKHGGAVSRLRTGASKRRRLCRWGRRGA